MASVTVGRVLGFPASAKQHFGVALKRKLDGLVAATAVRSVTKRHLLRFTAGAKSVLDPAFEYRFQRALLIVSTHGYLPLSCPAIFAV